VRESKDVTVEGRVQFDLLQVVSYIYMTTKPVATFCMTFLNKIISSTFSYSLSVNYPGYAKGLQAEFLFIEFCIRTLSWGTSKSRHFKCP
jgi:hypothetical protein